MRAFVLFRKQFSKKAIGALCLDSIAHGGVYMCMSQMAVGSVLSLYSLLAHWSSILGKDFGRKIST